MKKHISVFILISLLNLITINCVSFDYYLTTDLIKIKIVDSETNKPIKGISVYHFIIYNAYDKMKIPFDMCGKGWFQIVTNQYISDDSGYLEIPFTKVYINRPTEGKYYDSFQLLINSDSDTKLFERDFKVITPQSQIRFNQLYSKYQLLWWDFKNFYRIRKEYSALLLTVKNDSNYNEKELNNEYIKFGINYKLIKSFDNNKFIEIKLHHTGDIIDR